MPADPPKPPTAKAAHEIEHGRMLAAREAENIWGWGSPAGQRRAQRRANLIIAAAGLAKGRRVLELGCGTGLFSARFSVSGAQVTAIDISPDLIAIARRQVKGVQFICERFEDSSFSHPFDAVIGSSVLHHLDIPAALEKSYQVLKPGGRLAFAEPNMLNPQVFAERTFLRRHLASVSPDETAFVRWRLARQLAGHGFTEIHIQPFDWLHPATPPLLMAPVEKMGRLLERIPGIREFSGSLLISCKRG